jgi:putative transcriptional regulator
MRNLRYERSDLEHRTGPKERTMQQSLAPGFLIASPPLGDPNFDRTVVLLALHNDDGALGFVVNRTAPLNLGELLQQTNYQEGHHDPSPVWVGGPVQPQSGWVVIDDPDLFGDGVIAVGERLRVSSSRQAFDDLARDAATGALADKRCLVLLGYSGWAPGQLESEIARGAWLPVPLDAGILFDVEPEQRWERAYALLGLTPTNVMSMRTIGSA